MRRKLFVLLVSACLYASICSGCDYNELENMVFIAGMGVDRAENGEFLVSVETITMSKGGKDGDYTPEIITATGRTVLDAAANMVSVTSGELRFSHCQIIILHEDIAREGIRQIVDAQYKNRDFDVDMSVFVAKGSTAQDVLSTEPLTARSQSFEIISTSNNKEVLEKSFKVSLHDLYKDLHGEGITASLPCLYKTVVNDKEAVAMEGAAIFKDDRLAGFLDGEETRFYLFAADKIKDGVMAVPLPKDKWFSARIRNNKTKLTPLIGGGEAGFTVETDTTLSFVGFFSEDVSIQTLERYAAEFLRQGVTDVLKKSQDEFSCDLVNLGDKTRKKYPAEWNGMENREEAFAKAPFEAFSEVKILAGGRMSEGK